MAPRWRHEPLVASCSSGKVRFPTLRIAHAELRRVGDECEARGKPVPTRAYECAQCGGWHITSKERG